MTVLCALVAKRPRASMEGPTPAWTARGGGGGGCWETTVSPFLRKPRMAHLATFCWIVVRCCHAPCPSCSSLQTLALLQKRACGLFLGEAQKGEGFKALTIMKDTGAQWHPRAIPEHTGLTQVAPCWPLTPGFLLRWWVEALWQSSLVTCYPRPRLAA